MELQQALAQIMTFYSSMTPGHIQDNAPISPQPESTFPYVISFVVFEEKHKSGTRDPITVAVSGDFEGLSPTFRGFLIEARQGDVPIGTFSTANNPEMQTIDCGSGQKNAITHTSPIKKERISATWYPPTGFDERIDFHFTVVQEHDTFWVNQVRTV